jgi:hypothetical protein
MLSRVMLSCCVLAMQSLWLSNAGAQDQLAWKFVAGESLKYSVTQGTDMQMSLNDQKQNMSMNQQMDMLWKINEVDSAGTAVMSQIVERVQMKTEGGALGTMEYDSASGEKPDSKLVQAMADVFARIINQPFAVTMASSGKISDVNVPEELLDQLTRSGAAGQVLNKEVLEQMMTQSAITLPDKAIKPGDSWPSNQKVELEFGTMNIDSTLTYNGMESGTNIALISMKPSITVKPKEGNPITLTVNKTEGEGTVRFDQAKGRIVRSDLDLTLEMTVKNFGAEVRMTLRQKTAMELAE